MAWQIDNLEGCQHQVDWHGSFCAKNELKGNVYIVAIMNGQQGLFDDQNGLKAMRGQNELKANLTGQIGLAARLIWWPK